MTAPASIGPFKIAGVLGEGAMGVVYLARREDQTGTPVALKVLRQEVASPRALACFDAEVRALAAVSHPHVARYVENGWAEQGLPYYAMEFVPGAGLLEFCESRGLRLRERLELFLQVCEAVEHAHRRGVLHRDLKPENVLVAWRDGRPQAKLIDFGLARSHDAAGPRADGPVHEDHFVGTPAYMSPEQADPTRGDLDPRSDVYSLGALLYELLCGALPFGAETLLAGGLAGMRRVLQEQAPVPPSARTNGSGRRLRGDLDAIALRALAKRPCDRYRSAHALAEDVRRHLAGWPVEARAHQQSYVVRRLVAGRKVGLRAAAVLLLALVGSKLGMLGQTTWRADYADDGPAPPVATLDGGAEAGVPQRRLLLCSLRSEAEEDCVAIAEPGRRLEVVAGSAEAEEECLASVQAAGGELEGIRVVIAVPVSS